MSTVSGVTSSNSSSIYGSRNVLSGLASGLDTESMIENAVSGIKTKISSLGQKQTKLEWKQEAYRSITDKMVAFSQKYTSYTSSTNLLSASFFNKAVVTTTDGTYADLVSATGNSSSEIQVTSVDQLATKARYAATSGVSLTTTVPTDGGDAYVDVRQTLGDLGISDSFFNSDGNASIEINGKTIGSSYTKETTLETILNDINNNTEAGVSVSYSKLTNKFVFTSKETGSDQTISMGSDTGSLTYALFGDGTGATSGTDAVVTVVANGETKTLTRSSNTISMDGLSVTVKGTFNTDTSTGETPVNFTTTSDADKIVDAVKSMIDDYNAMVTEIHSAYTTVPLEKANRDRYEPLTEEDEADMTDTAIENYEKKAKTGLLFGDSDLTSLYGKLLSAITPSGSEGAALKNIGITTDYSEGLTTLKLDEGTMREALSNNPDSVKEVFTKSKDGGSATDGLMTKLKTQMDTYASVTGSSKGVLITKAGSSYSSLSLLNNSLQDQIDDYDDQVDKWQDKLSDKIDYYTEQYTRLEQLISEMNSQSSALSGMLGTSS